MHRLSQSKLKVGTKPFPKSHSTNFMASTMPSTSTTTSQNHQPAAFRARTAEDVNSVEEDDDSIWGDDFDDQFLIQATQVTMEQIIEDNKNRPINGVHNNLYNGYQSRPKNGIGFPRMNSDEKPGMTPAESFNLRRKVLAEREISEGNASSFLLSSNDEELRNAKDKINKLESEMKASKTELEKLRGESSHFKREFQRLRGDMSMDWKRQMGFKKEKDEMQKKHDAELRELNRQLEELKSVELKDRFRGVGGKRKSSTMDNTIPNGHLNDSEAMEMDMGETELRPTNSLPQLNSQTESQTRVRNEAEIQTQTDEVVSTNGSQSQTSVSSNYNDLDWGSVCRENREHIFRTMDKIVELHFQIVLPTLKKVEKTASRMILEKMVRKVESKEGFSDVVDTMFERTNDQERRLSLKGKKSAGTPLLPFEIKSNTQYYEIKVGLETSFKYGGVWGALAEVRDWIEKILKSLDGIGRFRIYEQHALSNFWRLLFWAKEFWRSLLLEEESEDDVVKNKKAWVDELEGWTGLVLKCDWRDYFVLDLEIEVRKVTLNILEYIICAGYFEQKNNRYRILYRIFRDVLLRDCFQNAKNISHILKIVTWSISDVHIMKYMCFKNNNTNNCLARLIGECVLKLIREEENEKVIVFLFMDYAYLVESLMLKKPFPYFQSKYARDKIEGVGGGNLKDYCSLKTRSDLYRDTQTQMVDVTDSEVTGVAALASQFACPVKYDKKPVEDQASEPPILKDKKEVERLVRCWVDPKNYEDPFSSLQICQCRKTLLATAVILLEMVFEIWKEKYLKYERDIERQLDREEGERRTLENSQNLTQSSTHRLKQLQDKKKALDKLLQTCSPILEKHYPLTKELSLITLIRHKKELVDRGILEFFPDSIAKMKRKRNMFDVALSKGVLIINFLQHKSDNLAAALGSEAYKSYMSLIPQFRMYMPLIDFNRIDKDILTGITVECEEYYFGAGRGRNSEYTLQRQFPGTVTKPSIDYPIPHSPLVGFRPMNPEDLEELTKANKRLSGNKTNENETIIETEDFAGDYSKSTCKKLSVKKKVIKKCIDIVDEDEDEEQYICE